MAKYVDEIFMVTEQCCNCGITFAMTQNFRNRRLNDKQAFYCPSGHRQYYSGESEEQKLKRKIKDMEAELGAQYSRAYDLQQQKTDIEKAHMKMRKRVKNGVCPCCNRTFQNLASHMKTKHPEFGKDGDLKIIRDAFGLSQSAVAREIGVNPSYISNFENKKYVPDYAESMINDWIGENT